MPWCLQSIDWFSNCTWFPRFLCPAKMKPISPSTSREAKIMVVFFQRGINWHWFINSLLGFFRCPSVGCKLYNYQFVKWFQKHELQNVKLALFSMRLCWYETATHFDAFASYGIAYYVGRRNVILILRFRRFTVFFQQSIIRVSKARWQERFTPPPENNSGFQNGEKFLSL